MRTPKTDDGAEPRDHDGARASLARLEGPGSVTLLPGHGDPWRGEVDAALVDELTS